MWTVQTAAAAVGAGAGVAVPPRIAGPDRLFPSADSLQGEARRGSLGTLPDSRATGTAGRRLPWCGHIDAPLRRGPCGLR